MTEVPLQSAEGRRLAALRYIEADAALQQAFRDGINVHGAMSAMVAADDELRAAMQEPCRATVEGEPAQAVPAGQPVGELNEFGTIIWNDARVAVSLPAGTKIYASPPAGTARNRARWDSTSSARPTRRPWVCGVA